MKRLLFTIALLLSVQALFAQLRIPKPILGVRAGLNVSGITGYRTSLSYRSGLNAGIFAEWPLGAFALSPELNYSREGARAPDLMPIGNDMFIPNDRETVINTDYLQLPIVAKWYVGNVSLDAGAQYGYLLSSSGYSDRHDDANTASFRRTGVNSSVFSILYGASAVFSHFAINVRVVHGLTPVFRDEPGRGVNYRFGVAYAF